VPIDIAESSTNLLQFVAWDRIPFALVVILVAFVAGRIASQSLDALGERISTRRLMFKQISAVTRFAVLMVATVIVASSVFSFSREALLAVGGSAAVAIGFAFKDLLASLMAGIILLFDRPFQVGDRISFDKTYGEVVEIGLRTVRVNTLDDNLVSIPNHLFLNQVVASANAGALHQMCVHSFYVGCNENIGLAKRIVYEAVASSRYVYLDKPVVVVVAEGPVPDGAERFAVELKAKAYVFDGRYETAFGTDLTERVRRAFGEQGIRTAGEIEWLAAMGEAPAPA
jgi:small-conductance mechanosensitive channel